MLAMAAYEAILRDVEAGFDGKEKKAPLAYVAKKSDQAEGQPKCSAGLPSCRLVTL